MVWFAAVSTLNETRKRQTRSQTKYFPFIMKPAPHVPRRVPKGNLFLTSNTWKGMWHKLRVES